MALLRLMAGGTCEFALSEALFDYDFPGHYRRQIRWVSVDFADDYGEPTTPNAVLTQLGHKTVLRPEPSAVKYLLDPKGSRPTALRSDWRPRQQVALSHVQAGEENNGLFRLNLDDDRYLPFEGTGAVSTWRLQLTGRRSVDDPACSGTSSLTVRYTADGRRPGLHERGQGHAQAVLDLPLPRRRGRVPRRVGGVRRTATATSWCCRSPPTMFPDMAGRQITAIYTRFELAGARRRDA